MVRLRLPPSVFAALVAAGALLGPAVWAQDDRPRADGAQQSDAKPPAPRKSGGRGKKQPPRSEPVPGYSYRVLQGFHVLINEEVLAQQDDARFARPPLDVLELELKLIVGLLPSKPVAVLRTVPIWAEWKKPGYPGAVAVYHAGPTQRERGRVVFLYESLEQQVKSNAIEVVDMESLTGEHQPGTDSGRSVLLHELSHAVHHHLFDSENVHIKAAYQQAVGRGLYRERYAATNEKEYFAELSCAYFDRLAYPPRSEAELKEYDPLGYHMMELTWGTVEQITAIRNAEARKVYGPLVGKLRSFIRNGKLDEARAMRDEFLTCYRGTKAAELAQRQFDELVEAEAQRAAKAQRK